MVILMVMVVVGSKASRNKSQETSEDCQDEKGRV